MYLKKFIYFYSIFINLYCNNNLLTSLEGIELLHKLKILDCSYNQLTSLKGIENLPNLKRLDCSNNPIYDYIETNYEKDLEEYIKDLKAVQLIESWFLEVRYSPDYAYCRRKVNEFYDRVVNKLIFYFIIFDTFLIVTCQ